jgi:hypothetical protein
MSFIIKITDNMSVTLRCDAERRGFIEYQGTKHYIQIDVLVFIVARMSNLCCIQNVYR